MSDLLITFLGRVPNTNGGYRTTTYQFDDGSKTKPVAFFGWSLQQRIKAKRVMILGTAGSMWDHLFELDIDFGKDNENERLELAEAVENQSVTQEHLNRLQPLLEEKLDYKIEFQIIPYCKNEMEQVELLRIIADEVKDDETVHLDITHGFRHLPMLSLLAALYIQQIRQASIEGIWYGSFDAETGNAPVINLTGLLRISEGIQALAKFNQDSNYGVFIPMLESSGLEQTVCDHLKEASYYENILNVGEATGKLRKVVHSLNESSVKTPESQLLLPVIKDRLNWVTEVKQFEKQIKLAQRSLEQTDYLRATLYAYEAVITRLCQRDGVDVNNFDNRQETRKNYESKLHYLHSQESKDYKLLKNLRNNVAHGSRGNKGDVQKALLNESVLRKHLNRLIQDILNDKLPSPI